MPQIAAKLHAHLIKDENAAPTAKGNTIWLCKYCKIRLGIYNVTLVRKHLGKCEEYKIELRARGSVKHDSIQTAMPTGHSDRLITQYMPSSILADQQLSTETTELLAFAVHYSNLPFNIFEDNPFFEEFFRLHKIQAPNREQLSGVLLDKSYENAKKLVHEDEKSEM